MPPPVFASYARADRGDYLNKFMREFQDTLGAYQAPQSDDRQALAVFDKNLGGGEKWETAILLAVRQAKVLVCMLSHDYLRRPWCGRELQVFLDRDAALARPAGNTARFIFPIWWMKPLKPRPLPAKLAQFSWRDPNYPARYHDSCVWELARRGYWLSFRAMADALAQLVHDALEGPLQLPEGGPVDNVEDIVNAFDDQQDFDARFFALAANGADWQPGATDVTVRAATEQAERKLRVPVRPVDQSAGLVAGLLKAEAERQIILLVVDSDRASDPDLTAVDGLPLANLAVLLVETNPPARGVDAWLADAGLSQGSLRRAKTAGWLRVAGPGALEAEMQLLLEAAGSGLRAGAQRAKVESSQLAERARAKDGFDPEAQPHLAGIAGSSLR